MTMTVSLSDQRGDKNEKLTQTIERGLKKKEMNFLSPTPDLLELEALRGAQRSPQGNTGANPSISIFNIII